MFRDGTVETDESLAAKGPGGDMDTLDALVRLHQSGVFNLALRMVWRRDVAEDATQEILMNAVTSINYEGLPPVAADFDAGALRADIWDSQRNNQSYRDFTRRAMEAGVQDYFAFLRGKRVTYFGGQGDQHTEWFPNEEPVPFVE